MSSTTPIRVAIAQAAPVPFDLGASIAKAVALIHQAADRGAKLVSFGESFLPGYPAWVDLSAAAARWDDPDMKDVHARLRGASLRIPSAETDTIADAAKERGIVVAIGANERVDDGPGHGTLYNALLIFDADGTLVVHHRKLVPTHGERLVWGPGDADGLTAPKTAVGRVGGLICWEHWMPLARQALHESAEWIHIGLWPTVKEMHQVASRHYAFEGRCFVLATGSLMSYADVPGSLVEPRDGLVLRGGSCIIGPEGGFLCEPVFDEEQIILADLDPALIQREALTLDVTGHYARPDVLRLEVLRGRRK